MEPGLTAAIESHAAWVNSLYESSEEDSRTSFDDSALVPSWRGLGDLPNMFSQHLDIQEEEIYLAEEDFEAPVYRSLSLGELHASCDDFGLDEPVNQPFGSVLTKKDTRGTGRGKRAAIDDDHVCVAPPLLKRQRAESCLRIYN